MKILILCFVFSLFINDAIAHDHYSPSANRFLSLFESPAAKRLHEDRVIREIERHEQEMKILELERQILRQELWLLKRKQ